MTDPREDDIETRAWDEIDDLRSRLEQSERRFAELTAACYDVFTEAYGDDGEKMLFPLGALNRLARILAAADTATTQEPE